jgi:predicted small lipoprotein YifL
MRFNQAPLWAVMLAFGLAACGEKGPGKNPNAAPARDTTRILGLDAAPDIGALRDTVRARALRGDTLGLVRILQDDSAYRREIYPLSEAYDAKNEETFRFVLGMHKANSVKGLKRLLRDIRDTASGGGVLNEGFDSTATAGGLQFETRISRAPGIRLFGSAFCGADGCRVVSFAEAGTSGEAPENGAAR